MAAMDPANAKALEILESFGGRTEAAAPIELPGRYLAAVERAEALPENRERADKSWVEASRRDFREYIARARRARPEA
jgi:hypothetical protein